MEKRAYIIKADGTEVEFDHRPTLEEAQKAVGGWIQMVHCQKPARTLLVDEEGLLKCKPINVKASNMWKHSAIVGDVLVLEGWKTVSC